MRRKIFFLSLIYILPMTMFSGNINIPEVPVEAIPSEICEYSELIKSIADEKNKKEAKELYLQLVGVLVELRDYRKDFLTKGELINLFPTAYYHTTLSEMQLIRLGTYHNPIIKMKQMLYFFDAFKVNREAWKNHPLDIETHWKKYYDAATADIGHIVMDNVGNTIDMGIRAHVLGDLSRAIRFVFKGKSYTKNDLEDFNATNKIFHATLIKTNADIKFALGIDDLSLSGAVVLNNIFHLYKSEKDVIRDRTKAWGEAFTKNSSNDADGNKLKEQPITNHFELGKKGGELCPDNSSATLFLFDVSGSMKDKNKWQDAKASAISAIKSIGTQAQAAGIKPSIGIRSFDGDCIDDPTKEVIAFTSDMKSAEEAINTKIPPPGGGTPLPQSIKISEEKLKAFLSANNLSKGKMIVLTDGESSCNSLRPEGVYAYGQYAKPAPFQPDASPEVTLRIYTVGFDIAPGSNAERDLQYLSQSTGGKYINAGNQVELTDAFLKFSRFYIPKTSPSTITATEADNLLFKNGLQNITDELYDKALENYLAYVKNNPDDANGAYNLALMAEANQMYKMAIRYYEIYMKLNPNAAETYIPQLLDSLRATAMRFEAYNKLVVKSDLDYLNLHFKKVQNGESIALADEFKGFIKEKFFYYKNLPIMLDKQDRLFKTNANEVFKGLKECAEAIDRNPKAWDRDATPMISRTYINMERLLQSF